ncbi:MaoC family dehydratase [Saccharopolyspora sp. ASAGF58]|uniref:MaoC family dehydratase n=1 Tax=Saccharopolyspora sp. ASAGF58 TaxID=2719023 RepID=UPI00143FD72D|nr:MaoC family dehydratase [Saccharopolyspora sp. ASAGF58]QIZ37996.1 dehydratase [Saccharopolyspora sp. ASAGF58]
MADPLPSVSETVTTHGRTVTDADLLAWAGLVHDFTRLHVDAEYMKDTPFGRPIAHGYIAMNLSVGLMFPEFASWYSPDGQDRALGWANVRFVAPVHVGDTLSCCRTVTAVSDDEIAHRVEVLNQDGTVVMTGTERLAPPHAAIETASERSTW